VVALLAAGARVVPAARGLVDQLLGVKTNLVKEQETAVDACVWLLDNGVEPANPDFEDPAFVPEPTTVDFDLDYISQNLDAWQSRYDRLLRGKKVIEDES